MSRYTSLLVLENDQMFAEFGIKRTAAPTAGLPADELGLAPGGASGRLAGGASAPANPFEAQELGTKGSEEKPKGPSADFGGQRTRGAVSRATRGAASCCSGGRASSDAIACHAPVEEERR